MYYPDELVEEIRSRNDIVDVISTYVKLKTVISWTDMAGEQVFLQDKLNGIFPNILPLLVVFGVYFYIKKAGPKYVRILVSLLVIALILSFFGIV